MLKPPKESDFLEDVLPLFEALLPAVGHLLDGHHFRGDIVPGVVDGPEGAVPDLAEVIEQLIGILGFKEQRDIRILQAARPERKKYRSQMILIGK